jgi:hypothetical protein
MIATAFECTWLDLGLTSPYAPAGYSRAEWSRLATTFEEGAMEHAPARRSTHERGERRSARDRAASRPGPRPRGRLRAAYFGAASFWGFVTGSAAVIGALRATGQGVPLSSGILTILGVTATIAIGGGLVLALAYREATYRRRR